MGEQAPELEILFDATDANTHQPAATYNNIGITVEENGGTVGKRIDVLRKYLKIVVRNKGNFVAGGCRAWAKVIIPDADKDNDNRLRYPSTEQKLLFWESNDHFDPPIPERSINVSEEARLFVAFADSDFPNQPIQESPKRFASLATRRPINAHGRDGIVVQDSFHTGDFEIAVIVTSDQTAVSANVKIHVDQSTLNTTLTSVSSNQ